MSSIVEEQERKSREDKTLSVEGELSGAGMGAIKEEESLELQSKKEGESPLLGEHQMSRLTEKHEP